MGMCREEAQDSFRPKYKSKDEKNWFHCQRVGKVSFVAVVYFVFAVVTCSTSLVLVN